MASLSCQKGNQARSKRLQRDLTGSEISLGWDTLIPPAEKNIVTT